MIPKIIHYCWFGRNPKPKLAEKCIRSWKKHCRGYKIIEWNEDNYDLSKAPLYVRQAYEAKKWAFVTDYVRLQVVYENGGIYMDTDVELLKPLDSLLSYDAYFGFEDGVHVATGLGFGAVKGCNILKEMMDDYRDIPFVLEDGTYDLVTCPVRNTKILVSHGLIPNDDKQILDSGILILPKRYFSPIDNRTGEKNVDSETISVHWFSASWCSDEERKYRLEFEKMIRRGDFTGKLCRAGRTILGEKTYKYLRDAVKKMVRNAVSLFSEK